MKNHTSKTLQRTQAVCSYSLYISSSISTKYKAILCLYVLMFLYPNKIIWPMKKSLKHELNCIRITLGMPEQVIIEGWY